MKEILEAARNEAVPQSEIPATLELILVACDDKETGPLEAVMEQLRECHDRITRTAIQMALAKGKELAQASKEVAPD